ncbi:MEKHLA domain-containing protein [Gaertneriomyces semiglobifer]|nr:MEKHLA domain-containing protein [Gaertneriomyces semiglobifer]
MSSWYQTPELHLPGLQAPTSHRITLDQLAEDVYGLRYPLLTHSGTPTSSHDPVFTYGNAAAQMLFRYSASELLRTPSRLSAPEKVRAEREEFMRRVKEDGFCQGYTGLRIRGDGSQFQMTDADVWNLQDEDGRVIGQAALIKAWEDL